MQGTFEKTLAMTYFLRIIIISFISIQGMGSILAQSNNIDNLFTGLSSTPGIAVAVYHDSKVIYENTHGLSNLDHEIPIKKETVFEIGGLTMHFTASCILKLEDEGKLALNDPLTKHLEDFPSYQEGIVTIQHLLNHTSGVMDYLVALGMSGHVWDTPVNSDDAYDLIIKNPRLGFEPGHEYEYSNSNYQILNQLIRKITGQSINTYATENIFKPLEMESTFYYEDSKVVVKNRATGYSQNDDGFTIDNNYNFTSAGEGRLYTSLKDLMIWTESFEQQNHPIKDVESRLTRRGQLNDGTEISYAMGLQHGVEKGYPFYAHSGYWSGFSAMFLKIPEKDFWIITLSNNATVSAPGKAYDLVDLLINQKNENRPPLSKYKVSKNRLKKYEGDFITYKNGYLRKLVIEKDTLRYQEVSGRAYPLLPTAKDRFKLLGSITNYTVEFSFAKGEPTEMQFFSNGFKTYKYEQYLPSNVEENQIDQYMGAYKNEALGFIYHLKKSEGNNIEVSVKGKVLMNYTSVMSNIFCSESTHHGYLQFNEEQTSFTLSDYSFKPILFEKIRN